MINLNNIVSLLSCLAMVAFMVHTNSKSIITEEDLHRILFQQQGVMIGHHHDDQQHQQMPPTSTSNYSKFLRSSSTNNSQEGKHNRRFLATSALTLDELTKSLNTEILPRITNVESDIAKFLDCIKW